MLAVIICKVEICLTSTLHLIANRTRLSDMFGACQEIDRMSKLAGPLPLRNSCYFYSTSRIAPLLDLSSNAISALLTCPSNRVVVIMDGKCIRKENVEINIKGELHVLLNMIDVIIRRVLFYYLLFQ